MNEIVTNRSEIVFLYDIKDGNPNGDPLDDNKPRIDEETGINLVTDVRLKRTIRDYLYKYKKEEIFIREIEDDKGHIQDAKARARDFLTIEEPVNTLQEGKNNINENLLKECIDARLFGVTIPLELKIKDKKTTKSQKSSIIHTGPVQFKIGKSMHRVFIKHFRGTGAFASKTETSQKTFREEDFLPYSLINFYGIINENAAKGTLLTENDIKLLLDGIWNGTSNLISRTKFGQVPRLLLKVNYSVNSYHIGDINGLLKLVSDTIDEEIRDISQVKLELAPLLRKLSINKDKVANIEYLADDNLSFVVDNDPVNLKDSLEDIGIQTKIITL
ncbi:type I-B CRISPR-associated protein Cas7/Csh2 [Methanosalsum natronophilum]|uniref:type I-B CRISPR-associated protein Cas7/Csh2 n=1 Tax=Methanosalsum natronophilum TaxID=768733 RepID=UPI00216737D1|nr:type I-B CRISPR-associated protein Cas7/Csh2 [Methanosalsum natronophilum]MCS3923885.1 CRISPR-associated protein Csh2 [Methanosalsum natronophilum]